MRAGAVLGRLAVLAVVAPALAACSSGSSPSSTGTTAAAGSTVANGDLHGLFRITPGQCGSGGITSGSYFRMIQPGGKLASGPFVVNGDSSCSDKTWTPVNPGTAGGLTVGAFQPQPAGAFDGAGNSQAAAILAPTPFFAVKFGMSTNPTDPQTGLKVPAPEIRVSNGTLSGQLQAVAVSWNHQQFNQGAPKPGGATSGLTSGPRGTYDPATHAYTLEWSSQIVGGPFNNFTGIWHLTGTFQSS